MNERKERALKAGALALIVLAGTCAVLRSPKPAPLAAPPVPMPSSEPEHVRAAGGRNSAARQTEPPAAPVIDEITLEKDEVCEGEENLVTVRAHTPDGNDGFLHYKVGPANGPSVALRSYLDDRGRPTAHRITVFGKNNVASSVDVPRFRVKQCDPGWAVVIEHRLLPNATAEFEFDARIVTTGRGDGDGGSPGFRPRRFTWSFGDGSQEEGALPTTTHDFATRPQATLYSEFLVTVEVLGDEGRKLRGRHALELLNPAYEAFAYKGIVLLFSDLKPRFPVLSANGVVDQGVVVWHTRPEVVTIDKITVTTRRIDGQRSPPVYPPVGSVLGASVIPPGPGLELHVVLDTQREPDTLSRDYYLEGQTPDGHPVRGAFSIMRPPALPTKDRHEPISDPLLLAKVKIAREVLHREYVTDEDIWKLERAGQFDALRADASSQAPGYAPPNAPSAKPTTR